MHIPVLLSEAVDCLQVQSGQKYIDCTFGGGGHTQAIADRGGLVLALDADESAIQRLSEVYKERVLVVHANFENVAAVAVSEGFGLVSGVLFDLGLSSYQIAQDDRGFSFMRNGPLDMRFDQSLNSLVAGELIDALSEEMLADLFVKYGDEVHAQRIAKLIKKENRKAKDSKFWSTQTTEYLAQLIEQSIPRQGKLHPATKVFQALRMAVNDEVGALERGLDGAVSMLGESGRIVVIAFHSVEDRIVKSKFEQWQNIGVGAQVGEIIVPSEREESDNPRARSAKMRVFEKS